MYSVYSTLQSGTAKEQNKNEKCKRFKEFFLKLHSQGLPKAWQPLCKAGKWSNGKKETALALTRSCGQKPK
ncbi:MAG: hypothetical protein SPK03_00415 [Alloprevotella sp.]|nr:hypothetical protein [Alloprevotella sp.]